MYLCSQEYYRVLNILITVYLQLYFFVYESFSCKKAHFIMLMKTKILFSMSRVWSCRRRSTLYNVVLKRMYRPVFQNYSHAHTG